MGAFARLGQAALAGCGALSLPAAALAESIPVEGVYPARANIPAEVELILVDRFQGDLGQDVELALTDVLGRVTIRSEPWFDLIRPGALRGAVVEVEGQDGTVTTRPLVPDAELRGTVRSEAYERDVEPKVKRECIARDDDGDCVERREVRIECRQLTVRVEPRILLSASDGRQLYSHTRPREQSERYCADEHSVPSVLEMANSMVEQIVSDVRADLAPVQSRRNIRVMERRRDLRREDRNAFRDAVRLTDDDVDAACTAFEALEATNPNHVSVLFNIGLCYESGYELDLAADYYTRALRIDSDRDYPRDGMRRIRERRHAEEQLAQREAL